MTRQEQIRNEAARLYAGSTVMENVFIKGAEWADAHPCDGQEFAVIKKVGKFQPNIIRVFSDKNHAIQFVEALRASETYDFVKYSIALIF